MKGFSQLDSNLVAWAAGFIDGEGSIMLNRAGANSTSRKWTPQITLVVQVAQVVEKPIRLLQSTFGGKVRCKPAWTQNQQPQFVWVIGGSEAYEMLEVVRPYLVVKCEQASLAVDFYKMCYRGSRGWNLSSDGKPKFGRSRMSQEDLELREAFHSTMKTLNLRGKAAVERKQQVIQ